MVPNYSAKKAFCLDFSRNCRALLECLTLYKKQDLEKVREMGLILLGQSGLSGLVVKGWSLDVSEKDAEIT